MRKGSRGLQIHWLHDVTTTSEIILLCRWCMGREWRSYILQAYFTKIQQTGQCLGAGAEATWRQDAPSLSKPHYKNIILTLELTAVTGVLVVVAELSSWKEGLFHGERYQWTHKPYIFQFFSPLFFSMHIHGTQNKATTTTCDRTSRTGSGWVARMWRKFETRNETDGTTRYGFF